MCHFGAFGTTLSMFDFGLNRHVLLCFQRLYRFSGNTAPSLLGKTGQSAFNHKILWQKF
jgi:hypothetical protein